MYHIGRTPPKVAVTHKDEVRLLCAGAFDNQLVKTQLNSDLFLILLRERAASTGGFRWGLEKGAAVLDRQLHF
jgi:hypothetical protein